MPTRRLFNRHFATWTGPLSTSSRDARFPRFQARKRTTPAFRIPQRVRVVAGCVYVPKVGWVRIRQSQGVEGATGSATFKRDACGHWYATVAATFEMADAVLPAPDPARVVGIDVGLIDFAVLSTAEPPRPAPKFFRQAERKLRRAQRVLSRRNKASQRREKAKRRVARIHEQTAARRGDFLHKLSTTLIRRFDGVCIETLNLRALARTKLGKSVLDAAFGEFYRQLSYKAQWRRKHLIAIGRYFPSTKRRSACRALRHELTLSDRVGTCVCRVVHQRDPERSNERS